MEARKAKTLELLSADRARLLQRMPFVGSLLMRLDLVPVSDSRLQTAATDGDNIFVDIDFYASLTAEERMFVIAHETWHCALLHFLRRKDRDKERFNCAADLEIHFILSNEGFKAPFVLPHDPAWQGLSAEEIYERYPSRENTGALTQLVQSEHIKSGQAGRKAGFDRHLEKGEHDAESGDGEPENGGSDSDKLVGGSGKGIDVDYSPGAAEGAEERCRERIAAAIQQYQRLKGDLPDGLATTVQEILKPKLDWRELLSQFVTSCFGGDRQWIPPSRRHVWRGIYLQSQRQQRLRAVLAVDTSGSTLSDLPQFLAEINGVLGSFGRYDLTVIDCDAAIQDVREFSSDNPMPDDGAGMRFKGGGGTDFRPVFEYIENHSELDPSLLIYFTDGAGKYPEHPPSCPVMWAISKGGGILVDWGVKVPISDD